MVRKNDYRSIDKTQRRNKEVRCAYCGKKIGDKKVYMHRADIICPTIEGRERVFCSEQCGLMFYATLRSSEKRSDDST